MNSHPKKFRKFLIRFFIIIIGLYLLLIVIASPLTKFLVQKYDIKYTGREITLQHAFINPLGGSASLRNLKMFEEESDSIFLSVDKISVDISLIHLVRGIYQVDHFHVIKPEINVFRSDTVFNFTDLLEIFAVQEDTIKKELKFNILDINVKDGLIRYGENDINEITEIPGVNFSSPGMRWDVDSLQGEFSFIPVAGEASGNFLVNLDSLEYKSDFLINGFDLSLFNQYLVKYAGKASLKGIINMDVSLRGNFNQILKGKGKGRFELTDFHFGKDAETDYASIDRFLVEVRDVDLKENRFYFDSILINKPEVLYQMYDTLDNFRRLISPKVEDEAEETADSVENLVDLKGADYYIKSFALTDGKFEFNDYSIAEKFTFLLNQFNIRADSVDKQKKRVKVTTTGKLHPSGTISATFSMDPENEDNFDFAYEIRDVPATIFNPYIITYTSYQLDRGTIEMHGTWNVRRRNINSLNHFLVIDPRDTKKVRGKDSKWIPLPLIMSFVRERGGVIDYQIPVKGSLDDPGFKLWDIISDLLRNILEKPPTTPYRMQVRNLEEKVEKTLAVKWRMRQVELSKEQGKFIEEISEFLKDNPEAFIVVEPIIHAEKEMENILLFEAKKKFYLESNNRQETALSDKDSMTVEKMSSKDPDFIRYLDSRVKNADLLTLQEKCYNYTGKALVQRRFNETLEARMKEFRSFFIKDKTDKRVEFLEMKNRVPYNWFSFYEINYKGDIPELLKEAFNKLYELDAEPESDEFSFRGK